MEEAITNLTIEIILLVICLVLSVFFSGSEAAIFSLPRFKIHRLRQGKSLQSRALAQLLARPQRTLLTILAGNNLVNVVAVVIVSQWALSFGGAWTASIAIAVLTLFLVLFCETFPKLFALQSSWSSARFSAVPLLVLGYLLVPLEYVTLFWTRLIEGKKRTAVTGEITEQDIEHALSVGTAQGTVDPIERKIMHNLLGLTRMPVAEVMVPRAEVISIPADASFNEVSALINHHPFSTFPVHEGSLDNIVGIVHVKSLHAVRPGTEFRVRDLMRPPLFVSEYKRAFALLLEFKSARRHLALVVDEYGSFSGLITTSALFNRLTGHDLKNAARKLYVRIDPHTIRCRASITLEALSQVLQVNLSDPEYDTLAGFMLRRLRRIPMVGDAVDEQGYTFTVWAMKQRRVWEVEIRRTAPEVKP